MTAAVWGYLDRGLRGLTPFVLTIGLVLISVLPIPVPGTGPITPALTLMAVYYWSVHRPDLLPIAATFIVGVVQDTLSGAPLGMTSLVLLSVQGVVMAQYRFFSGKTFMIEWWGFLIIAPQRDHGDIPAGDDLFGHVSVGAAVRLPAHADRRTLSLHRLAPGAHPAIPVAAGLR